MLTADRHMLKQRACQQTASGIKASIYFHGPRHTTPAESMRSTKTRPIQVCLVSVVNGAEINLKVRLVLTRIIARSSPIYFQGAETKGDANFS